MDGSSRYFVESLLKAEKKTLKEYRDEYIVKEVIHYRDEESGSEMTLIPWDNYQITTMVDFGTKVLGTQNATLENLSDYVEEISSSRTFSFLHELEMLLENGLIQGGDLNNAIVYVDKALSDETMARLKKAFNKTKISVQPNGILDNLSLHYPNEAARHKLLDVIGDLALVGKRIRGKIIARKPGHKVNVEFARKLSKIIKQEKRLNAPSIDINQTPLLNVNDIMKMLPHRPPFLLVDKIFELSESHVIGLKSVTMNEPFFVGHFPGAPVMPGVLQIEAMAQVGGVLVLNTVPSVVKLQAQYAYLDMQYDSLSPYGLHWASYISIKKAYDWIPDQLVEGIDDENIIGIEAPLWSETISNFEELSYLAFPRLLGYAEIGWSKTDQRNWEEYQNRLIEHGVLLDSLSINYYRSPKVAWKE